MIASRRAWVYVTTSGFDQELAALNRWCPGRVGGDF